MEAVECQECQSSMASTHPDEDMFISTQENIETNDNISKPTPASPDTTCNDVSLPTGSHSKEVTWRGTPLNKLNRNSEDQFPHLKVTPLHTVLFKLPVSQGQVPKPLSGKSHIYWNKNHVCIPHSFCCFFTACPFLGQLSIRWELIKQSLRTTIHTSLQLEVAILKYNSKYSDYWNFNNLHSFFSQALDEQESENFFKSVLPKIIDLALSLPKLVTNGIPLLKEHSTHSISLSQQQISCLLANAFLCTFPRRNTGKKNTEYNLFHNINFASLFNAGFTSRSRKINHQHEKLKCLINYFQSVTTKVPEGVVTFSRHYIPPKELPIWYNQSTTLCDLYISDKGTIEDGGTGMMEIDFANRVVGGGVLEYGCVQEEIRFITYPELILARLFTEVLDDTEALIVQGCERFNKYHGYSENFKWAGNVEDSTPRDRFGRRCCTVVAIDAIMFPRPKDQYKPNFINRELNKAYAGFSWGMIQGNKESVASGNWGCGAFRGDAHLKALLQLMAASTTGRQLAYFTFGQPKLRDSIADMHSFLLKHKVTVGDLWALITSYNPTSCTYSLYNHIYTSVTTGTVPNSLSLQNSSESERKEARSLKKEEEKVVDIATLKLSAEGIKNSLKESVVIDCSADMKSYYRTTTYDVK